MFLLSGTPSSLNDNCRQIPLKGRRRSRNQFAPVLIAKRICAIYKTHKLQTIGFIATITDSWSAAPQATLSRCCFKVVVARHHQKEMVCLVVWIRDNELAPSTDTYLNQIFDPIVPLQNINTSTTSSSNSINTTSTTSSFYTSSINMSEETKKSTTSEASAKKEYELMVYVIKQAIAKEGFKIDYMDMATSLGLTGKDIRGAATQVR